MDREDLGVVTSWNEVFARAHELVRADKLEVIATVSLSEFTGDGLTAAAVIAEFGPLHDALDMMSEVAATLYQGNERFQLILSTMDFGFHPHLSSGQVPMLTVVYLKHGEEMPANAL